jgi:hypothetical protein|tara:strand:- start:172 stop:1527 length:1356 start_codon:yes stop_codon:yes gene_type:complete
LGDKNDLADKLIIIEESLNELHFKGVPIGHLLSKFNENIYRGIPIPGRWGLILSLIKFLFTGRKIKKPEVRNNETLVLLSKISNKPQCNALIDPLKKELKDKALLYSPLIAENEIEPYVFIKRNTSLIRKEVKTFIEKHKDEILTIYSDRGINVDSTLLSFSLWTQLIALTNWIAFFDCFTFNKIIVDFDRDYINAPLVLAAKHHKIQTVTLVHGVINPPYGYYPIIADEIWMWGDHQKKQMIESGLEENKIRIVGNPIVRKLEKNRENYLSKSTIGIALGNVGKTINDSLLRHVLNLKALQYDFQWIIKLHPSMKKEGYLCSYESEKVELKSFVEISNESLFNQIDFLILGNSGLGYEALINDIPLLVYLANENSKENDHIMIKYGNCPQINNPHELDLVLTRIATESDYKSKLMRQETPFLTSIFYKTGRDSTNEILKQLNLQNRFESI